MLLFAADKPASDLASAALDGQTEGSLRQAGVRYVADVSGMPGPITSLFALPKLRQRPYPVLLVRDAAEASDLPRRPHQVTLLELTEGKVTAIRYLAAADEVRQALVR